MNTETNGTITAIEQQRNRALTDHALVCGKLALANEEIEKLKKQLEESEKISTSLRKQLDELDNGANTDTDNQSE